MKSYFFRKIIIKKYSLLSSAAVVVGALRVDIVSEYIKTKPQLIVGLFSPCELDEAII